MKRRHFLKGAAAAAAGALLPRMAFAASSQRPNILLLLADDWGWPAAPLYGEKALSTPAFDRVAREGILFSHAYCAAPTCTASRGALLTGQDMWRLGEGCNLLGTLPASLPTYPDLLRQAGYAIGSRSKGWSPGNLTAGGRTEQPAGPPWTNKGDFKGFLASLAPGQPFCFWFATTDPHRPYEPGSGIKAGLDPKAVRVPGFLPDVPEVRSDLCDYFLRIQRFNRDAGNALAMLEESGRLENTLVVITGDNGLSFPRGKMHLYEYGVHQPLAMLWKGRVAPGRVVDDFTSFIDFAPTFLEAAGLGVPPEMTGRSLLPLLRSPASGQVEADRDRIFTGLECHGACFPSRSMRTQQWSYIRNFTPGSGMPGPDRGPTAEYLSAHRDDPAMAPYWQASFGPRPAEELYDLASDPFEMRNLAGEPSAATRCAAMREQLMDYLRRTGDPRASGKGGVFDTYRTWDKKGNVRKKEAAPAE